MPYISSESRLRNLNLKSKGLDPVLDSPGTLNYEISLLIKDYLKVHKMSYQTINDILGALDGASREFYRRIVEPYENTKLTQNGDIY